jgi:hypothetical protein
MSYQYTQLNRLEEPHNYMYTPFGGVDFLCAYREDREAALQRIVGAAGGDEAYESPVLALLSSYGWHGGHLSSSVPAVAVSITDGRTTAIDLSSFSITAQVDTNDLLEALLSAQMGEQQDELVKSWLDRLVQRFEVTKKLYVAYLPGFRKGEGANNSVLLYWRLALSLALFYARTKSPKYLNTLLKVNDLLASLPPEMFSGHLSEKLMATVFQIELAGVAYLAEVGGGAHAAQ